MAAIKIQQFLDDENEYHEMQIFVNSKNRLFIEVKSGDDYCDVQFITLNKKDVYVLILELKKLIKEM